MTFGILGEWLPGVNNGIAPFGTRILSAVRNPEALSVRLLEVAAAMDFPKRFARSYGVICLPVTSYKGAAAV